MGKLHKALLDAFDSQEEDIIEEFFDMSVKDIRQAQNILVNNKINVNWNRNESEASLLHLVSYRGDAGVDALKLLLNLGANPNLRNKVTKKVFFIIFPHYFIYF